MCGIAGFVDSRMGEDDSRQTLSRMLEAIAHRGPDARDMWHHGSLALGHNRLSILDLSADGKQPMHAFGNVIVFNGEIYNYREIRKELELLGDRFHTQTDTEVILAAYRRYGVDCVQRFVGMWAFALWDTEKRRLFCSRDRFGIKPFHYILQGDRFYFGSEYKALRHSPLFSNKLNVDQALRGLQLGWNAYRDESYYDCIKTLPAGCNLIYDQGRTEISRYWDIDLNRKEFLSPEDQVARFRELFIDSVRLHMRSDVEVGACLSGGLDSSAIVSAASKEFPDASMKTFTVYYEGKDAVDERPWVKEVISSYPQLKPFYLQPTEEEIRASFDRAIYHADVPLAGSSPVSQYFVMQLAASQGIKVVLDGQGSDEFLGGYLHSFYRLIGSYFLNLKWGRGMSTLHDHIERQGFTSAKGRDVLLKSVMTGLLSEQHLYATEYKKYFPFLGLSGRIPFTLEKEGSSRLSRFLYHLMFTTSLPTLLQFEDRNSMAFSIESRVPFLDHRLVEFAFSLSDETKINKAETKWVLRQALQGILPKRIAERRDKKGFVTPGEVRWLRGPLSHLLEADLRSLDFLNIPKAQSLINDFKSGDTKNANLVWRLAVLSDWCKKYA